MAQGTSEQQKIPEDPSHGRNSRRFRHYASSMLLMGMASAGVMGYSVGTNKASLHRLMFGMPALPSIEDVIDNADSIKIVDRRSPLYPNSVEVIVGYTDNKGRLSEVVTFDVRDNQNKEGGFDLKIMRNSLEVPFYAFGSGIYPLLYKEKVPQDVMKILKNAEKGKNGR